MRCAQEGRLPIEKDSQDGEWESSCKEQKTSESRLEWNWKMKAILWGVHSRPQRAKNGLLRLLSVSENLCRVHCSIYVSTNEKLTLRNESTGSIIQFFARKSMMASQLHQVFFYRARTRTMGRFHADVSGELGLNNWCWSHYRQASVYAAGGKYDLAARDRQVRGFRYRWTLWDGNTSHPSDHGMRPQSERMFDTSNQCRWLLHLSWWLMWERTVSGNVLCSQNKFRCVGYCKKLNKYLQAGILK